MGECDYKLIEIYNYFVFRKSASCTHVSGLLHALVAMTRSELWSRMSSETGEEEQVLPITSYACQWNVPKKRKESSLPFSEAKFTKHVYGKEKKRSLRQIEGFVNRLYADYANLRHE